MKTTPWLTEHNINIGLISPKYDVVVIGGGPAGLLTAFSIASSSKAQVLVLEKKIPGLHLASPTFASMHLHQNIGKANNINYQMAGLELLKSFIQSYQIDCDAVYDGGVHVAHSEQEFKVLSKLAVANKKFTSMDEMEVQSVASVGKHCYGGLYIPQEFVFNAQKFLAKIVDLLAVQKHACLSFSDVINIKNTKGKSLVYLDNNTIIEARHLVYCTATPPVWLKNNLPIFTLKSYNVCGQFLNKVPEFNLHMPQSYNYEQFSIYHMGEKLYIGQILKDIKNFSPFSINLDSVSLMLKNSAIRFGGDIRILPLEVYATNFYTSSDYMPIVGKISDNEYVNIALGQSGFAYAPLTGAMIADAIFDSKVLQAESKFLSPDRF